MNDKLDGSEIGLLAYLPFSEEIPQTSGGTARQEFTNKYYYSQWDAELQEYVSHSESAYTSKHDTYEPSNTVCAPVTEKASETNLRFNFITKDNELIIELAEPAKSIERTTVNITAMGIEDMNGNEMEQPVIWSAFINRNMQLCAEILMGGQVVSDKENIIAAFDESENCLGQSSVTTDQRSRSLLYLTIYGDVPGAKLHFRMWDAQSGIIYALTPDETITYTQDGIVGSYDNPVRMTTSLNITRELALEPTWTWVSLNVVSDLADNVNELLKRGHWIKGDQLKDLEEQTFFSYDNGKWLYNGSTETDPLRTDRMYCIKSQERQTLQINGRPLMDTEERTVTLHHDWNYIGYTPLVNLPVNEALADFYSKASDGDIIKSQDEFATFSIKGGGWYGNLEYMKPGEGYMLFHQVTSQRPDETVKFTYPFKSTAGITGLKAAPASPHHTPLFKNRRSTTMTMIVQADGVEVLDGDRLLAYADGDLCGVAEARSSLSSSDGDATDPAADKVFYLSVGGDRQQQLVFTLERDGQLIGTATRDGIGYKANLREGTTDVPRVLHFNGTDTFLSGAYYTLSGICCGSKRPKTKGVYIYNNQKVLIK
jgi:hypothetical protein